MLQRKKQIKKMHPVFLKHGTPGKEKTSILYLRYESTSACRKYHFYPEFSFKGSPLIKKSCTPQSHVWCSLLWFCAAQNAMYYKAKVRMFLLSNQLPQKIKKCNATSFQYKFWYIFGTDIYTYIIKKNKKQYR